jgi:ABC-2 type transport system ATP-binding protein
VSTYRGALRDFHRSPRRYFYERPSRVPSPDSPVPGVPLLSLSHFTKRYATLTAVDDLSFEVPDGAVLGLVGPNGAGKTTTLRALAGIIRPTTGTVRVAGIDLAEDPVGAKRQLAFVPDEPHLFDYLTVTEHLRFVARLYGVANAAARIPTLLAELELTEKKDVLPPELSRGMKQKLAIACGLLHEPRVLLLDEPLTGLDPIGIRNMKRTIASRAEQGTTVLLSSHLLTLVEELCSHLLVIRRGKLIAFGPIGELRGERRLEELFLELTGEPEA